MNNRCKKCDGEIRAWEELTDEEREVVKRLPGSIEYSLAERQKTHTWCTRCWAEIVERKGHQA